MDAKVKLAGMNVLGEMDKTGVTVFKNIIDKLLHYPENDQFLFFFQPFFILMKTAAGIDGTGATDFLEQVIDGGF